MDCQEVKPFRDFTNLPLVQTTDSANSASVVSSGNLSHYSASLEVDLDNFPKLIEPNLSVFLDSSLRINMYGTVEEANVTIIPDTLLISSHIHIKERICRVLNIKNNSVNLPVIFKYLKVPFIDVEPHSKQLQPKEAYEVQIYLKPQQIGSGKSKISFELLYKSNVNNVCFTIGKTSVPIKYKCILESVEMTPKYNPGITPMITNEVGFNSKNDLFPNKAVIKKLAPIRTLFPSTPRSIGPTGSDVAFLILKKQQQDLYGQFLRARADKRLLKLPPLDLDYELTDQRLLLAQNQHCDSCDVKVKPMKLPDFIPLRPSDLNYVKVYPKVINTGPLAQLSTSKHNIFVRNENKFSIDAAVRPHKRNVEFLKGNRRTIRPNATAEIEFSFYTFRALGTFDVTLDVVINDSNVFEVNMTGKNFLMMLIFELINNFCQTDNFFFLNFLLSTGPNRFLNCKNFCLVFVLLEICKLLSKIL